MSARPSRVRFACIALVLACAALVSAADDVTFRYKWTKGETLRYRISQQTVSEMSGLPGVGSMSVTMDMLQEVTLTAVDVDAAGKATLEYRTTRIKATTSTPMGQNTYDSAAPGAPGDAATARVGQTLGAMIDKPITLVMAPTGKVERVQGVSAIMKEALKDTPQLPITGASGLDGMMSDEAMQALWSRYFTAVPDHALTAGESWQAEATMTAAGMSMTTIAKNTFVGLETVDGRSLVHLKHDMTLKPAGGGDMNMGGMSISAQMGEGSGSGESWFDAATGHVVRVTGFTVQPITMSASMPDGTPMSMQSLTRTTNTMELVTK